MTDTIAAEATDTSSEHEPTRAPRVRNKRALIFGLTLAGVLVGATIAVPQLISAADHSSALDTYTRALAAHDNAADEHAAALDTLGGRQELAATEMDGFLGIIRILPDDVLDPDEVKPLFVETVEIFRTTAGVTSTPEDETVPATPTSAIEISDAPTLSSDATTEEIIAATDELTASVNPIDDAAADLIAQAGEIDAAYDDAVRQLDAVMSAGRTWGERDVYEKDTAEQTAALIAAAQGLVKPEGESFVDLSDRATAIEAFVAARTAAKTGHEQTIAAEEEAARQAAAAEAERQAAAQRQQQSSNNSGSRSNSGSRNTNSTSSPNSGGTSPGGMGAPNNNQCPGCTGDKNVWG